MDVIVKFLLVTPVLDAQIAFDVPYLFLYGDDIPSLAETYLEKVCQGCQHLYALLHLTHSQRPDDGVQGIVQEMGINLGLQGL